MGSDVAVVRCRERRMSRWLMLMRRTYDPKPRDKNAGRKRGSAVVENLLLATNDVEF